MQGFDPERDLVRIGLANQTTMLRNETLSIGKMLEKTMMQKYGPAELKQHYMVMDTICDATQVRIPASLHPGPGATILFFISILQLFFPLSYRSPCLRHMPQNHAWGTPQMACLFTLTYPAPH